MLRSKLIAELVIGCRQVFGKHAGLAYRRNEIRVAGPARHEVQVYVIGDAGTPSPPEIHSQIETVRMVNFAKSRLTTLGQIHHLVSRLFRRGFKVTQMIEGS